MAIKIKGIFQGIVKTIIFKEKIKAKNKFKTFEILIFYKFVIEI